MNTKVKVLSLAIAAVLAGCGGTPEKKVEVEAEPTAAAATPAVEQQSSDVVKESEKADVPKVVKDEDTPPVEEQAPVASVEKAGATEPKLVDKAVEKKKLYVIPKDDHTFLVTTEPKDKSHPFYGRGLDDGFVVNGEQGREVVVRRGETYKFEVDTGVKHDFYLSTSPQGWGSGTYADGVKGQFIFEGEVTFTPTDSTPDLLYYQCRNHKYMGGKIYVLDKGEDLAQLKASLAAKEAKHSGGVKRPARAVSASSVKQKLSYAQMVLMSKSAKRVEASGNAEAIETLNQARKQIANAKSTLAAGDAEVAMKQVNEGLRLVTAASRAVTTEGEMAGVNQKAKYDELLSSLKTYENSYKRNAERVKKSGQTLKASLDQSAYDKLVREGKALGSKGDYEAANKSLSQAQQMITSVLTDMLHAQTITYDKKFESPKEEYEYELARLESYEELVPLAIEQKHPSQRALGLIDSFVNKAAKIKQEGKDVAAKGDYKMAIMAMQAATSNIQRALRIAGVN